MTLTSSCVVTHGFVEPTPVSIIGRVVDESDRPVVGARVVVDGRRASVSDRSGRFAVELPRPGRYPAAVSHPQHVDSRFEVAVEPPAVVVYVRMYSYGATVARLKRYVESRDADAIRALSEAIADDIGLESRSLAHAIAAAAYFVDGRSEDARREAAVARELIRQVQAERAEMSLSVSGL